MRNAVIEQKMNVASSLLDDIKNPNNFNGMDMFKNGRGEIAKRSYEMEPTRKKKAR